MRLYESFGWVCFFLYLFVSSSTTTLQSCAFCDRTSTVCALTLAASYPEGAIQFHFLRRQINNPAFHTPENTLTALCNTHNTTLRYHRKNQVPYSLVCSQNRTRTDFRRKFALFFATKFFDTRVRVPFPAMLESPPPSSNFEYPISKPP
jgi:hypothetical protein